MTNNKVMIFCDGSCTHNPGAGGFGAIIITEQKVIEIGGHRLSTTNNQMELQAAISALHLTYLTDQPLTLFTDSMYVINGITQWVHNWEKNHWKSSATNKAVLNQILWQKLLYISKLPTITWQHIKAHAGFKGNERADTIAKAYATKSPLSLYIGSRKEYPIKKFF